MCLCDLCVLCGYKERLSPALPGIGEQFFSPQTVERIQALVKGQKKPARVVETPVYEDS